MEYQIRNWLYYTWTSGDHIVDAHVHGLDVVNWVMNGHPVKASGNGGRAAHGNDPRMGNIFDHFALEFEYANGVCMFSQSRQISGCDGRMEEVRNWETGRLPTRNGGRSRRASWRSRSSTRTSTT